MHSEKETKTFGEIDIHEWQKVATEDNWHSFEQEVYSLSRPEVILLKAAAPMPSE